MSEKKWYVYVHINKTNGKRYVGITSKKKPEDRWKNGYGYQNVDNPYFFNAIQKYGWDGFEHVIVCAGLSEDDAKATEMKLIKEWHTREYEDGYNLTDGGDGAAGFKQSAESRKKRSLSLTNPSEETRRRRSESLRGRKFTDAHKRKIGDGNSKAIEMLDLQGNVLRCFRGARDAEAELNIKHSHISQCCHGKRMTTGGYMWRFAQ